MQLVTVIVGHNGSGKSAVLSALTVALGGKANTTGRGSGLKAFIREGQKLVPRCHWSEFVVN